MKVGGKPGSFDEDRFWIHVAPSKATTGLLCSNLLSELLAWAEKKSGAKEQGSGFMAYYSVMVYTEALCCELLRQGFRVRCGPESRAKRLSLRYKGRKAEGRPAKSFSAETLRTLEHMVKDNFLKKSLRSAAGQVCPEKDSS